MAKQAKFYVKNKFADDVIKITRKFPDSSIDLDRTVAGNNVETVYLPNPETALVIETPGKEDIKDCYIKVASGVDLTVSCSRRKSNWTIKIDPDDLLPDIPTDANVEVGNNVPG